ncbi:MAG: tRNA 2-thiouridine(34) synthase MnmA [Firmicutes bacterium]|nr:tRNA 2-thiouridine(34) synthase MnmA [Bacillota bacterium]MCM1401213.1 tRNA 2-thiouridine(34) synthase MnmA [Bacteroides sp.]MCM1477090.1 tRNA 2-thiouridine(34) synthase MnmA [Bacteroides sp.]
MRVAALISGGVDSAVAVHRLVEQGHDVNLFYIRIGLDNGEGDCSAEEDIEMCSLIAHRYGLPLEVVSLHQEYWDNVMQYALDAVKQGLTPNPDVMCNRMIKFGFFEQRWGHEFDRTATGHYATTVTVGDKVFLGTAPDPVKDQTDFLSRITYGQLSHLMFPIGDIPKKDVREIAREADMPNAYRRDSQGICFLGKINYNDFLRRHLGEKPGAIVEIETGKKLGEHKGYWFHTIGQRKGLGLGGGPWFVVKKCIPDNVIYVSRGYDTEKQYGRHLHLDEMHWITLDPWPAECSGVEIAFKNRHSPEFMPGRLTRVAEREYVVESDKKVQGIAPGQFTSIYSPDCKLCYGSGVITGRNVQL